MSLFKDVPLAPPDAILGTALAFKADTDPRKVNVGIGAYRDNDGKPVVLKIVRKCEQEIANDPAEVKEYSPVDGNPDLKLCTSSLLFGEDAASIAEGRIASSQALSGTGSLRVVAEFVAKFLPPAHHTVWIPDPTWGNHPAIFESGGMKVEKYPYWHKENRNLDFAGMMAALGGASEGSCVLLHAVAHNPTGVDPTEEQWNEILQKCKDRKLIPIIDNAYQGFASGCLIKDSYACRLFEKSGLEFFVCQSFAKSMGLYGERIGMVHCITTAKDRAEAVLSQLKKVIRPMYSSPPIHGAKLVCRVLGTPENFQAWADEVKEMAVRIHEMRTLLRNRIESNGTPGTWNHITDQIGMFSFTGLTVPQSERMISEHHVYMLKSGRISMAGVNTNNVNYLADSLDECVRNA